MELVHVQEDALEEIRQQAYQAACEVCEGAKLREDPAAGLSGRL